MQTIEDIIMCGLLLVFAFIAFCVALVALEQSALLGIMGMVASFGIVGCCVIAVKPQR